MVDLARELALQRTITLAFIMADPVTIVLTPRSDVRQPSGGVTTEDLEPRVPQVFRLISQSFTTSPARSTSSAAAADAGQTRKYPFVLLGTWDAVVAVHDWWEDDHGQRWIVDQLQPSPAYEVRALVTEWGGRP